MKILHINTFDISGGAARAAYRLHKALLKAGVESLMLVEEKFSDDFTVIGPTTRIEKGLAKVVFTLDQLPVTKYKKRSPTLFSPAWISFSNVIKKIEILQPDVVHLHWICAGMMRIEDIAKIKQPIVWSLHDMWAFTGGCHYDEGCEGYKKGCGYCKVLRSHNKRDLSVKVFERKKRVYTQKKDMTIVGLSKWLNNCAVESVLLKDKEHIQLPNPIDTDVFRPFDKLKGRELWNLPRDKKLVLFGAMNATSDKRKGFYELAKALEKLKKDMDIELVVFGSSEPQKAFDYGFKTHYLGRIHDDVSLVTLYSAVDVMVVPSLQENLSNAIMESLACGTPVVGFNIGGNGDMIEHRINGYLAKPFDTGDLAAGIEWILTHPEYEKLCENARDKVVKEFDSKVVAQKYIELYERVIKTSCRN